ncbi:MAG: iron chelate uptake ABC transporter family permease subunit, partial [Clostridium sp.]|nr:iron chelate uptake ABC transporter family permease subunit [Clostridium sp.]
GVILLMFVMVLSTTIGAADISFLDALRIILKKIPLIRKFVGQDVVNDIYGVIVLNIRLPRIVAAAVIGMGLSVVGAAYQGMFGNPMADPYILGVSSGAALGASIAIIFASNKSVGGFSLVTLSAFVFALLTVFVVFSIAKSGSMVSNTHLLLAGVAVSFFATSLISVMMIFNKERIEKITFWMMGSTAYTTWKQVMLLLPVVVLGTVTISFFARDLNIISAGEKEAKSLGVEVGKVKRILLVICSIIVASCVAVSGIIGFVGLIIPHTIRLIMGFDNRVVLPFSAAAGAIFLVLCDTIARAPTSEIPVGVLTAIFGAPYFISVLLRSKRKVN